MIIATHQNILVVLPHHQHDALGLCQVSIVDHVEALWGVLLVGLKKILLKKIPTFVDHVDLILEGFTTTM